MDPKTGEIRKFTSPEAAKRAGFTVPLKREPKKNCKKCSGRGHTGTIVGGKYVSCICTR